MNRVELSLPINYDWNEGGASSVVTGGRPSTRSTRAEHLVNISPNSQWHTVIQNHYGQSYQEWNANAGKIIINGQEY